MSIWSWAVSRERAVIGWDLGGAHLKLAWLDGEGGLRTVKQVVTPLWHGLQTLDNALKQLQDELPLDQADHYLTMTGELVDAFDDRQQGVTELVRYMAERLPAHRLWVYAGDAGFVQARDAAHCHAKIASANWHATAVWVARQLGEGLLVDLGSTTTDLLLLRHGGVSQRGYSDRERLTSGELLYQGVVRTPVMALVERVPFAGDWQGVAAEHFATMADVYRILDWLPENADLHASSDGRGKDPLSSRRRLARMLGSDYTDAQAPQWTEVARFIAERQLELLMQGVQRQISCGLAQQAPLVGAGVGRFLVRRIAQRLERDYIDVDTLIGSSRPGELDPAVCAPAVAVAKLGMQEVLACAS